MIAPGAITSFCIPSSQFYNSDVQDALDNYTGLTAKQVGAINRFINSEGANYDTYDEFFLYPLGASNGLIGFKGTLGVNNNDATFDIGGILFDGVDQYFGTTIIASSGLTKGSQDNLDIQCFLKDNLDAGNTKVLFGALGSLGTILDLFQKPSSNQVRFAVNKNTASNFATVDGLLNDNTLYGASRSSSLNQDIYIDGIEEQSSAAESSGIPDVTMDVGALNNDSTHQLFINAKIATWKIGAAIGFNQALHNTNVRQLLTDLGTI